MKGKGNNPFLVCACESLFDDDNNHLMLFLLLEISAVMAIPAVVSVYTLVSFTTAQKKYNTFKPHSTPSTTHLLA